MGIKKELAIAIVLIVFISLFSGVANFILINEINNKEKLLDLKDDQKVIVNHFVLLTTTTTLGYMDAIVDKDSFKVKDEIKTKHETLKKWFQDNKKSVTSLFVSTPKEKFDLEGSVEKYWHNGELLIKTIEGKDLSKIDQFDDQIDDINTEIQNATAVELKRIQQEFDDAQNELIKMETQAKLISLISAILTVIIASFVGFYIYKKIGNTLNQTTGEIIGSANNVLDTSLVFDKMSAELSSSMQQQAQSLQETVSALEEINQTVARNAEIAAQSEDYAQSCAESAEQGNVAIVEMSTSMKKIESNQTDVIQVLNTSNKDIEDIVQIIRDITTKTQIINDIVFQTKLLSFNASVEAARAGESGKGFAVVAEEVGNLATMSGNAAKEINDILSEGSRRVEHMVEIMNRNIIKMKEEGVKNISETMGTVVACENQLKDIITKVNILKEVATNINTASKEQSLGVKEINHALNEIDRLTSTNSTMAKQYAERAEKLAQDSKDLSETLRQLNKKING